MVKKTAVILGILAVLAMGAGMSWGYTVTKWPVPGIPGKVYCGGSPCVPSPENWCLKGPVAPSCEPPLIPGLIHATLSVGFRAFALAATPIFTGKMMPTGTCCPIKLGDPAYVVAAVPCTPVNEYRAPRGW